MELKKGQIWRIEAPWTAKGDEIPMDRPVIIVSDDDFLATFKTLMVVPLTSAVQYHDLNTNVTIRSARRPSTALCHMVQTISTERLTEYWGAATQAELVNIDIALAIGLGLNGKQAPAQPEMLVAVPAPAVRQAEAAERMVRLATERNVYKKLYEDLLAKVLGEEADEE